jgi:hypothetical protein
MKPTLFAIATVLPLVTGVIPTAHAVECAAGVFAPAVPVPTGPSSPDHEGQRPPERTECV